MEPHSGTINKVSEFCPFSIKSSITASEGSNDEKKELNQEKVYTLQDEQYPLRISSSCGWGVTLVSEANEDVPLAGVSQK